MGERDALGFAFGARGEKDHRRFLVRGCGRDILGAILPATAASLSRQRQLGAHIFQIDQLALLPTALRNVLQLAQLDKAVGGDDALDLRGA